MFLLLFYNVLMKSINCDNNRKNMLYNIQFSKNNFKRFLISQN